MTQMADAHVEDELARVRRELAEALEQQTATSEVLRVIASSTGELKPVFEAILANATRICEAKFATLYLREANAFRAAAMHNPPPAFAEARQREPLVQPPPDTALGCVAATKQVVHIADIQMINSYIQGVPYSCASRCSSRPPILQAAGRAQTTTAARGHYRKEPTPRARNAMRLPWRRSTRASMTGT